MATPALSSNRKRTVHSLETPYSSATWPEITQEAQDAILELLCNLLSPIGQHRRSHVRTSGGKRTKRNKQKAHTESVATAPHAPDICAKVDVGFNSVTNGLRFQQGVLERSKEAKQAAVTEYSMVFVARGNQSAAFNCHFPKMVGAAARGCDPDQATRLIGFSKPCSERLSSCLAIARVSSLAISRDAPGSEALWKFVKDNVPKLAEKWPGGTHTDYKVTNIKAAQATIGEKRRKIQGATDQT